MLGDEHALFALTVLRELTSRCDASDMINRAVSLGERITAGDTAAADELYAVLDDENDCLSIRQEEAEEENLSRLLDCAVYAVAILIRFAYEKEERRYFPEPIEQVDEGTVKCLKSSWKKCGK